MCEDRSDLCAPEAKVCISQDAERRQAVEKKRKVERSARARVRELERRREQLMSDAKVSAAWLCA